MKEAQPRTALLLIGTLFVIFLLKAQFLSSSGLPEMPGEPRIAQAAMLEPDMPPYAIPNTAPALDALTAATLAPEPSVTLQPGSITPLPSLEEFVRQVSGGQAGLVSGIYAQDSLALRVVQQPAQQPAYISDQDGTATQFQSASAYGVIGLLAHNFLSGKQFFDLQPGQEIDVVYGDGRLQRFRIQALDDFERLTQGDLRSDFRELANGATLSAQQVFTRFYSSGPGLTLQTCIEKGGVLNWGVRFISASPLDLAP